MGGFLAARFGLKATLVGGLATQCVALSMLAFAPDAWLVVPYVMAAQALSGIAKDLTKMSSKSAVKLVVPEGAVGRAVPVGGDPDRVEERAQRRRLLRRRPAPDGRRLPAGTALLLLLVGTALVVILVAMRGSLGRASKKAKFGQMFSNNHAVNVLAAARVFLFAARDVWFVVGLPVFLRSEQGWSFWQVGAFLAVWVIGYGVGAGVRAAAAAARRHRRADRAARRCGSRCCSPLFPAVIASALAANADPKLVVVLGLIAFGVVFALNSAVHSFLILHYADGDRVAMNVGFYYMANAAGRLTGTVLSGLLYQWQGLEACLWASAVLRARRRSAEPYAPGGGAPAARRDGLGTGCADPVRAARSSRS